jgi:hypothetical protein
MLACTPTSFFQIQPLLLRHGGSKAIAVLQDLDRDMIVARQGPHPSCDTP